MNKKVFTLLAASLMLFVTAFMANAQAFYGDAVEYLPKGVGKGAYHLKVTVGSTVADKFLAMDEFGYITLVDPATYIYGAGVPADSVYRRLRASMWCVNVKPDHFQSYGKVPGFSFTNKEYGTELAFEYGKGETFDRHWISGLSLDSIASEKDLPLVGGLQSVWKFSRTYTTIPLEQEQYLAIEVKPDYYMTFAKRQGVDSVRLVVAHKDYFDKNADFFKNELLKFTLVNARPRVLTATDFNTMMREYPTEGYRQLHFSKKVSEKQVNVFEQPLKAVDVTGTSGSAQYLNLRNEKGEYVTVASAKESDYVNGPGFGYRYPKIVMTKEKSDKLQSDWRLVYYPSEDSLVINVRQWKSIYTEATYTDNGTYSPDPGFDGLFNMSIWNYLTLRMQDLAEGERVLTVYEKPADVRAFFNINSCKLYETNRTTVPTDLYTIRDKDGRYLVVPLAAGDFTPRWLELGKDEVPNMTPAFQWFVQKVNEGSETSKIFLVNREFNDIQIEYVQIYKDYELFNGVWTRVSPKNKKRDYSPVMGKNYVKAEGFTSVPKPYRNDPYLGYKFFSRKPSKKGDKDGGIAEATDSINWFRFSFNYLNDRLGEDYYISTKAKDTTFYVLNADKQDKAYFQLVVPDRFRQAAYGMEQYGYGWGANKYPGDFGEKTSEKYIAPLERWYYYLKLDDYTEADEDYYMVLDETNTARYAYTKESVAEKRKLGKAKFYLRFRNLVNGVPYYALLDRIDISNFHHFTDVLGFAIMDTVRVHDGSHGESTSTYNSYGVIRAAYEGFPGYSLLAQPKALGSNHYVSTFTLRMQDDVLYRRFDTKDESLAANDNPDTLKFYRTQSALDGRPRDFIYEDAHSDESATINPFPGKHYSQINFAGVQNENVAIANKDKDQVFKRHLDTDWAIYVDTAYVNRGTGRIKPQYMLVMGPEFGKIGCTKCSQYYEKDTTFVYGRYLRNQTDSARVGGMPNGKERNADYIANDGWERLSFTPAIHLLDTLYILNGTPKELFIKKNAEGKLTLDYKELYKNKKIVKRFLGNNLHKDEVFSFRYTEKNGGANKDFYIESETTNRDVVSGRMIAPMKGGWVKVHNGVLTITRGAFKDKISEAEIWNVKMTNKAPLANAEVSATDVKVVAGAGAVTVLNAAGKKVTVSNILGQTVAKVILTSDNETIAAPQGVVVVAIEGENAVKAVVK
ncbi:DUF6383 domain-containing protein [Tannerella forsythia]|uniref:DUF6383 domain-containing protein n=1 Tax=Tannerella forsythia TaxID=28112 RepID=A0A3P1YSQ1_TANFO|nr:DUF6383 domain-containing protein [Tannerella forsythia]RRD73100.1 hypothetical protein EII41_09980 [Tannerella forsythia]